MLKSSLLAIFLIVVGCASRPGTDIGAGSGSNLAEANVGFPDKAKFGPNASKLSGFYLDIQPSAANCKGAFSTAEAYVSSKKFPQSIQQGCDWTFVAEVGAFDQVSKKLSAVYFSNRIGSKGKVLTAAEFKGKAKFAVTIQLDVTEEGKKAGFSGSADTMTETDLEIQIQWGDSSNKPSPGPSATPVPQNLWPSTREISITEESGSTKKLSEFVSGAPYILIDVSGIGCGGCKEIANMIESDQAFKSTFSGKCKHMTIEYSGNIKGWNNWIGPSLFAASHTVKVSISEFQKAFPEFKGLTPTLFLLSGDGKIIDKQEGAIPTITSEVRSACAN